MPESAQLVDFDPSNPEHPRAFAALNRHWLEQYFSVEAPDEVLFADPYGTIIATGGAILFAKVGEKIVGTCALLKRKDGLFELIKLAVDPAFQRRGIANLLITAIEQVARDRGFDRLVIISATSLPFTVPTFRKHGFTDCAQPLHLMYQRANITLEKRLA